MFLHEPIKFRRATATSLLRLGRPAALSKLSEICLHNAEALGQAVTYCAANGIGDFRINSQILPVKTHPEAGYSVGELPEGDEIRRRFRAAGALAAQHDIRLTFHPDQFVLLSSPDPEVTRRSVADLVYQAEVASWIGADVINIHAGGAYGDKRAALDRVQRSLELLPPGVRARITLENDDRVYPPR